MGSIIRDDSLSINSSAERPAKNLVVISWNIQTGSRAGFLSNNWRKRKSALLAVLLRERPDILCVQEARLEQLGDIEQSLLGYKRVGRGRQDGDSSGEFCAILFKESRFDKLNDATFWLSDTPDIVDNTWDWPFKRICTWVELQDRTSGKELFIFNTHFPLNPFVQVKSAELIVQRIKEVSQGKRTILCGDVNSMPESPPWSVLASAGLCNTELALGRKPLSPTYRLFGRPSMCIDGIFVVPEISVIDNRILSESQSGLYPSDHFGVCTQFR